MINNTLKYLWISLKDITCNTLFIILIVLEKKLKFLILSEWEGA